MAGLGRPGLLLSARQALRVAAPPPPSLLASVASTSLLAPLPSAELSTNVGWRRRGALGASWIVGRAPTMLVSGVPALG